MKQNSLKSIIRLNCAMITLLTFGTHCIAQDLPLTNAMLAMLDGKYATFDGQTISDMLIVRRGVRKILYGMPNKSGAMNGDYNFEGRMLSVHELATLEQQLHDTLQQTLAAINAQYINMPAYQAALEQERARFYAEFEHAFAERVVTIEKRYTDADLRMVECWKAKCRLQRIMDEKLATYEHELKLAHCSDCTAYRTAVAEAYARFEQQIAPLMECLALAKADFIKVNAPFMEQTMGTKALLLQLIEEFCCRHELPNSFLLSWGGVEDGQEVPFFEKSMTNCRELAQFCSDLTLFIGDLVKSCPKGYKQFEEHMAARK